MAETPTAAASGTQTSVLTTEHVLFDSSAAGLYSLHVDVNVLAAADILELRCYQMVLTGGTRRVLDILRLGDAQSADALIVAFDPIGTDLTDSGAIRFTLKQTVGTVHAYPWKVLAY